ncbi:glycosyltransferase [Frigidibacter oleivorans]|uniref:glycosyltransferase n=1 Tax=Frigidibacter oleivorans TaxID=2487129 RepID=UPI000F8DDA1A|nr:glycosyltransferase [Frigidibacter oleivorans]
MTDRSRTIALVWDNYGPMHVDRGEAVQRLLGPGWSVVGIEQFGTSDTYAWVPEAGKGFRKVTVMSGEERGLGTVRKTRKLLSAISAAGAGHVVMCNYERPEVLTAATILRLRGRRLYVMGCSKFDDYDRSLRREALKSLFFLPYQGGISSGYRARDYMRFLGLPKDKVQVEYNTLSIDRIRQAAGVPPAPGGLPLARRHFTIVARFVPKKNLHMALRAYAAYLGMTQDPRELHLCGSGELEGELRALAAELGIADRVIFRGFLQTAEIAQVLGSSLALLLPSIEEQFGNVVIEAQAMGLPVILSDNCGARDRLIRSGWNGFVVEPDNPEGMAWFMARLSEDAATWTRFATNAAATAPKGDVERFAEAVARLVGAEAG